MNLMEGSMRKSTKEYIYHWVFLGELDTLMEIAVRLKFID